MALISDIRPRPMPPARRPPAHVPRDRLRGVRASGLQGQYWPAGHTPRPVAPLQSRPVARVAARRTVPEQTAPAKQTLPASEQSARPAVVQWRYRLWHIAQYPLIAGLAIAAAYSATIGQWFVVAYAALALLLRLGSRLTFAAALLLLASIPFFQILKQSGVSQNAAIYTYELLVVGTLQAGFEAWQAGRHTKRQHKVFVKP